VSKNYLEKGDAKLQAQAERPDGNRRRHHHPQKGKRRSLLEKFLEAIRIGNDCWEWIGTVGTNGYGVLTERGKVYTASRYSYEIFIGSLASKQIFVCHHCDNPLCVRPSHLFVGTSRDNAYDALSKNRHLGTRTKLFRESNPMGKLTAEQVEQIRSEFNGKRLRGKIHEKYGISPGHAWKISRGLK